MEHIGGRLQVSAHAPDFVRQKKRQKSWPGHYLHTYSKRASDTKRMWIFLARTHGMQMACKKHTGEFPVYTQFCSTRMCRKNNLESRASKMVCILSVSRLSITSKVYISVTLQLKLDLVTNTLEIIRKCKKLIFAQKHQQCNNMPNAQGETLRFDYLVPTHNTNDCC